VYRDSPRELFQVLNSETPPNLLNGERFKAIPSSAAQTSNKTKEVNTEVIADLARAFDMVRSFGPNPTPIGILIHARLLVYAHIFHHRAHCYSHGLVTTPLAIHSGGRGVAGHEYEDRFIASAGDEYATEQQVDAERKNRTLKHHNVVTAPLCRARASRLCQTCWKESTIDHVLRWRLEPVAELRRQVGYKKTCGLAGCGEDCALAWGCRPELQISGRMLGPSSQELLSFGMVCDTRYTDKWKTAPACRRHGSNLEHVAVKNLDYMRAAP
jgi:hypothetical protein